jgi:hypothetical protein
LSLALLVVVVDVERVVIVVERVVVVVEPFVDLVTRVTRYITVTRGLPVPGPGFPRVRNLIPGPGPGPVPVGKPAGLPKPVQYTTPRSTRTTAMYSMPWMQTLLLIT